jgi:hypothetical protein
MGSKQGPLLFLKYLLNVYSRLIERLSKMILKYQTVIWIFLEKKWIYLLILRGE